MQTSQAKGLEESQSHPGTCHLLRPRMQRGQHTPHCIDPTMMWGGWMEDFSLAGHLRTGADLFFQNELEMLEPLMPTSLPMAEPQVQMEHPRKTTEPCLPGHRSRARHSCLHHSGCSRGEVGAKTRQEQGNICDQHPAPHTSFEAHQLLWLPLAEQPLSPDEGSLGCHSSHMPKERQLLFYFPPFEIIIPPLSLLLKLDPSALIALDSNRSV